MSTPPKIKEQAKAMYLRGYTIKRIHQETGLTGAVLDKWINQRDGSWRELRKEIEARAFDQIRYQNRLQSLEIAGNIVQVVHRKLESMLVQEDVATVTECRDLANILLNIDKIIRLDLGQATEIIKTPTEKLVDGFSVDQIKEIFQRDVFLAHKGKKDG